MYFLMVTKTHLYSAYLKQLQDTESHTLWSKYEL